MWTSIIAVLGTLAGAVVAGMLQHRSARTAADDARTERRRAERLEAVTALAVAVADHRRAMWVREDLRLTGAAPDRVAAARADSHATRAAITAPQLALAILVPALAAPAGTAVTASYALRDAADPQTLADLRTASITAADAFTTAAAAHFRTAA
ncbi:protein kilB [Streptomyces sp. NBC_01259]|uniref:protein kilB n=1 Tax=Streptomyces sp. NBC_01259 TaxID=2903800 RepID=UPI00324553D6